MVLSLQLFILSFSGVEVRAANSVLSTASNRKGSFFTADVCLVSCFVNSSIPTYLTYPHYAEQLLLNCFLDYSHPWQFGVDQ